MRCRRRASRLRDGEVFEEHVALDGEGRFIRIDRPADALLGRGGAPRRAPARGAVRRWLPLRTAAAAAVLDPGGGRRPAARRDAVRRLRLSARASTTSRSAATAPCARSTATACTTTCSRWPGLQDLTASVDFTALAEAGTQRRLRLRRLLHAGQLPARQRPGQTWPRPKPRRTTRPARYRAAPGSQAADPARRDGRALPGDGLPARCRVRRRLPGRRPELAAVTRRDRLRVQAAAAAAAVAGRCGGPRSAGRHRRLAAAAAADADVPRGSTSSSTCSATRAGGRRGAAVRTPERVLRAGDRPGGAGRRAGIRAGRADDARACWTRRCAGQLARRARSAWRRCCDAAARRADCSGSTRLR